MNFKVFERRKVDELNDTGRIKKLRILMFEDIPTDTKLLERELRVGKIPLSANYFDFKQIEMVNFLVKKETTHTGISSKNEA